MNEKELSIKQTINEPEKVGYVAYYSYPKKKESKKLRRLARKIIFDEITDWYKNPKNSDLRFGQFLVGFIYRDGKINFQEHDEDIANRIVRLKKV